MNIYLSSSQALLNYIEKTGLEIKLDDAEWFHVRTFPYTGKLSTGEVTVRIRGKGILPPPPQTARIRADKTTDFLLEIKAESSQVLFSSNLPETAFLLEGKRFRNGETFQIEPFKEYTVLARTSRQTLSKKFTSAIPGEKLKLSFSFVVNIHPMQRKYEEGMKLFKEKKYKEALKQLETAAKAGHPRAALQAAVICEEGLGMWFSDDTQAMYWYRKAADAGIASAGIKIADAIYNGDEKGTAGQMLKYYLLAVRENHPEITYRVSQIYLKGFREIKADDIKTLHFLQKAAELGHKDAMYDLGIRYEKGQGVPFNSQKALFWLRKAAAKGQEQAQRYLQQLNQ